MSETPVVEANPCKLRNGNWGCKTAEPVATGATVRIVTRANKQWLARVSQVVWTDGTVCICETESEDKRAPAKAADGQSSPPPRSAGNKTPEPARALRSQSMSGPDSPPDTSDAPDDELDAMADQAAATSDEDDDWLSAYDELARGG